MGESSGSDDKRFYPPFRWEGEQLLIDNTETFLDQSGDRKRPKVLLGRKLVETMNWIGQDQFGWCRLHEIYDNFLRTSSHLQ